MQEREPLAPTDQNPPDQSEILGHDEERESRIEYLRRNMPSLRPKRRASRMFVWVLLGLVLIGGAAGAGWWFLIRPHPTTQTAITSAPPAVVQPKGTEISTKTKNYASTNFSLSFDYPEDWAVADHGDGKLTVISPALQLKSADGQLQAGKIVLSIQNKGTTLTEFKSGNAVATRISEKIAYTKPTQSQRANTYLSFLKYAGATATGIDGIYITGDNGYQKDQAIPQIDVAKADPLITLTFRSCSGSSCADASKPLTLAADAWDDVSFAGPLKKMIASLAVQ